jgi:hypothetical protein
MGTTRTVGMLARAVVLALLLASSGPPSPVAADEPNQAGLVIQFDADRIETLCIVFEGQEIAGNDFLALSGLELVIDATSGLGITVCQIEGQGCAFPAKHCFCQCMGGEGCLYWNYFHREPGDEEWTYSPLGVLLRQVQPGSVEAWVWGDGQTAPDGALTFEAICSPVGLTQPPPTLPPVTGSPTPVARAAAAATLETEEPLPSAPPPATPTVITTIPATPLPTEQPGGSPTPASSRTRADVTGYLFFGLLVLGLILIGAVVWLRRR